MEKGIENLPLWVYGEILIDVTVKTTHIRTANGMCACIFLCFITFSDLIYNIYLVETYE